MSTLARPTLIVFDPGDLAEYSKLHFDTNKQSGISVTMADEIGEVAGTLMKVK